MAKFGLIGLGAMGTHLARNVANKGFQTVVYNRSYDKTEKFITEFGSDNLIGSQSLEEFVETLEAPRKIIIMVKAGPAVDAVIDQLTPLLSEGDIIIDGGNTHYRDTEKREAALKEKGLRFIGMGISGGEEGALNGPSMMPSGEAEAYKACEEILTAIAADDGIGGKCVTYIGKSSSGHFVKTVHNGIEYAIMQLIAESYDLLKHLGGLSNQELAETFTKWNTEENLQSFLTEITAQIFKKQEDGQDLIDLVKDAAKQKGTGKWTTFAAMDYGVATPTINAAVDARITSGSKELRESGNKFPEALNKTDLPEKAIIIEMAKQSLIQGTIISYFQGLQLLVEASKEEDWNLDISEIARIWRGGCIIRSDLLGKFSDSFSDDQAKSKAAKETLLTNFQGEKQTMWRSLMAFAANHGIPTYCHSSALSYYDSLRRDRLPQNLTQAQRDFFGAHTFERIDKEGTFHVDWN